MKRRLAFSTVSNLSLHHLWGHDHDAGGPIGRAVPYGVPCGHEDQRLFLRRVYHAPDHKHYIYEMDGFGRKMPWVYGAFTVSAIGMMGVPGGRGFISK